MSFKKNLVTARKSVGITQAELGDAIGVTSQAVSQWERGETQPELEKIPAIARKLKVSEGWLLTRAGPGPGESEGMDDPSESGASHMIRVKGYVGAGSAAHFYAVAQGDLDEVAAPVATRDTVAVEIRGESLGSLFDRWLVFYDEVRAPVTSDLVGKLCVVGLPDDRVLIKKIRNGRKDGLFRLLSATEDPIEDVPIAWAAKVKSMMPR